MEEINLEIESTNKKINKKNIVFIIVSFIFLFIVPFLLFDFSSSSNNIQKLEITNVTMSVEYNEYLGYSAVVKGTAKNISKKNFSYASVEFIIYDSAGNNLGTALANINNLQSGDTWQFEANLFSFPSSKPISYKLAEITAF